MGFPNWLHHFTFSLTVCGSSSFPRCLATVDTSCLLIVAILLGRKQHFLLSLISISLEADDVEHLFLC